MPCRIVVPDWIIQNIAIAIQSLRIIQVWYNTIRLGESVKIRVVQAGLVVHQAGVTLLTLSSIPEDGLTVTCGSIGLLLDGNPTVNTFFWIRRKMDGKFKESNSFESSQFLKAVRYTVVG
jgi:hypothetical protein